MQLDALAAAIHRRPARPHGETTTLTKLVALLLLAASLAPMAAHSHSHKKKGLEIVHPWTPAMLQKGTRTTHVFMTIKNRSGRSDRLLSASTPTAEKVELHELGNNSSSNETKPATAFAVAAGKDFDLNRKGPRLVLTGVKKQLHAYDDFKMTLVFEKAGRIVIDVMVEEAETEEPHKH